MIWEGSDVPKAETFLIVPTTCRFSFLPPDRLVSLSQRPNVPARWLALACAQQAAKASGGVAPGAAAGAMAPEEARRLKPRSFYRA